MDQLGILNRHAGTAQGRPDRLLLQIGASPVSTPSVALAAAMAWKWRFTPAERAISSSMPITANMAA
jgi:hypothetical protein